MKQTKHILSALAIAAALAVTGTGCTQDDSREGGKAGTTSKVHISVGAGIDDGAATRSAVTVSGTKRTLTFSEGDKLYVNGDIDISDTESKVLAGFLTVDATSIGSEATTATFTGDLEVYEDDGEGQWVAGTHDFGGADPLAACSYIAAQLVHAGTEDGFEIGDRRFGQYADHYIVANDVSALMTSRLLVRTPFENGYDSSNRRFRLEAAEQAILSFTVSGLDAGHDYGVALAYEYVSWGWGGSYDYTGTATADASGTARFAIMTDVSEECSYSLVMADQTDDTKTATVDLGAKDIEAKIYNVARTATVTSTAEPPTPGTTVTLSAETGAVTLSDGDVLTGTGGTKTHVTIAAGATVTLRDATIPGRVAGDNYTLWAGITCEGDATIILEGTNYAKGYYNRSPGVQAGPVGTTLTIKGSGALTAIAGNDTTPEGFAAGIGGGTSIAVGNIRIEDGTITASGNKGGAGIGSGSALYGHASCGDITISGGTITATGGNKAAGIGSGQAFDSDHTNTCGNITITSPATGTATAGTSCPNDIGAGNGGTCGTVSVAPRTINNLADCRLTLKYYQKEAVDMGGGMMSPALPAYNVNSENLDITLTIEMGGRTYTATGKWHDGSTVSIMLRDASGATLTVTSPSTGYDSDPYSGTIPQPKATFVGTLTGVDTSGTDIVDLGTVNLVKQ